MKGAALTASILLSILFLVVYTATNWFTAGRTDVGTISFEWERCIPFVPIFIVPYISLDLFFVAAPFLCRNQSELRALVLRIVFGIIVASVCFLLFPLVFAFERPSAHGWLGAVFDAFRGFDKPHNLAPSLHIVLSTIVGYAYIRRTRGVPRALVVAWFGLISFSTLPTYQHHVLDLVYGFALAALCFYLFRETSQAAPQGRNHRVGTWYAFTAAVCVILSLITPDGGLFLWPAIATGLTALAYFGVWRRLYGKDDGRLALSTLLVLGPCLLGQALSLAYYKRKCRAYDELIPRLLIGRQLSDAEARQLDVVAVLDLTAEFSEARPFLLVTYRNIPILDLTAPTPEQLHEATTFIAEQSWRGRVYVHCKAGYSRTAVVAGAYLVASGLAPTPEDALRLLRNARPSIVVRPEASAALHQFAADRRRAPRDVDGACIAASDAADAPATEATF